MTTDDQINPTRFSEQEGAEDWRVTSDGACAFFRTDSFAASAAFVRSIAELDGIQPPDIDVRAGGVTVRLITVADDHYGLTRRDLERARRISALALDHGLTADPAGVQSVLLVVGSLANADVVPFWEAVLGYDRRADSPEEDLVDPRDRGPAIWFEQMEEARGDGGGAIHIGIWMAPELAEARVAAALAAGGRMVRDDFAPAWWTLADAAGNEADIATISHRDEPAPPS